MKNQNENMAAEALLAKALVSSDMIALSDSAVESLLLESPELAPEESEYFSQIDPLEFIAKQNTYITPFPGDPMLLELAASALDQTSAVNTGNALDDHPKDKVQQKREELLKRLGSNNDQEI